MDVHPCALDFATAFAARLATEIAATPLATDGADLEGWSQEAAELVAQPLSSGRVELYRASVIATSLSLERFGIEASAKQQAVACAAVHELALEVLEELGPGHALGSAAARLPESLDLELGAAEPEDPGESGDAGVPAAPQGGRRKRRKGGAA